MGSWNPNFFEGASSSFTWPLAHGRLIPWVFPSEIPLKRRKKIEGWWCSYIWFWRKRAPGQHEDWRSLCNPLDDLRCRAQRQKLSCHPSFFLGTTWSNRRSLIRLWLHLNHFALHNWFFWKRRSPGDWASGPVVIDSWPLKRGTLEKKTTQQVVHQSNQKVHQLLLQNQYSILLPTVLHAPFYVSSWWSSSLSTFGSFKIPTESSSMLRKQPGQLIFLMKKYRIMLQGLYSFFQKASRPKKVRFHHHQKIGEVQPSQVAKTWATPPLHPSAIETLPPRLARFWWEIMPWHLLHVLDVFWSETCMWRAFFFIAFNDVVFSGKIYLSIER